VRGLHATRLLLPLVAMTAIVALSAAPARAGEEVKVTVEPEVIGLDETATLTIEVHGDGLSSLSSLRFRPSFELDNLETVGGPAQYDDMRFTNGRLSRTFRLAFELKPLGLGKARVRAISVQLGDDVQQLPAHEIRVQQEPTQAAPNPARPQRLQPDDDPFQQMLGRMRNPFQRAPQQPDVFVRCELEPQRPVVGQQLLYSVYLYTREDIAAVSPSSLPSLQGFWVRDIPLPQRLPMEMVDLDGRRYARVPLLKKALFPLRPGHFQLEPAVIDLTVQHYDRGFFFGPAVARPEQVRLRTAGLAVDVDPLPPAPPGFGGAVGQITLGAQLDPPQVHLGEAATLTVRLGGVGNLQGIHEPRITPPPGLTLLPPQQEGKDELNGTAVRGLRVWRYAVIPQRAGRFTLASPGVTYFDPAERSYQVAAAPALALTILPPLSPPAGARTAQGAAGAPRLGEISDRRWAPLLAWLLALPWGLALVVVLVRHRPAAGSAGSAGPASSGEARDELEAALAAAAAEETRPRPFALWLEDGWRQFLRQRFAVAPETSPSRWRELLAAQGVDGAALDDLDLLIEDLQYLRFAPQLSTTDSLRADALERSRRLLRRLA
jgi:hypothetical protein